MIGRTKMIKEQSNKMDEWQEQVNFFKTNKETFLQDASLLGKFIAIKNKTIIDNDTNKHNLIRRIQQQYTGEIVVVFKVEKETPIVEISTSEFLAP